MIRKFNYTGRRRVARSRISISLGCEPQGSPYFNASMDLDGLGLPGHARVYVEAYRRAFFMRFSFGTISHPQHPQDCRLGDMDPHALIMFRLKVVDVGAKGRILGVADRIIPRRTEDEPADRLCLLPVDFVDLGESIWRMDLAGDWPSLLLNKRIENVREIARSDTSFFSLVYPEVVRQILHKIVVDENHTDPATDPDDWMSQWLRFARQLPEVSQLPPSGDTEPVIQEKLRWIDDAVEAFCALHETREKFMRARFSGGQ